MTNAELLDLLREARESVFRDSLCREYDDSHKAAAMEEHKRRTNLMDRIDAALANSRDSTTEVVQWLSPEKKPTVFLASRGGASLEVSLGAERWFWDVSLYGDCATEAEAKSAAIAAARGLK